MKNKLVSRIPWREKIENVKDFRIIDVPLRMQNRFGKGKMLIPRPLDLEAIIKKVRKGKLLTKSKLREKLSFDFKADVTCPITSGIFMRIISEAAEEELEAGKKKVTPYWRVINNDGSLNQNFPGGDKRQAEYLKREGHQIEKTNKGKLLRVCDFEKRSVSF